MNNIVHILCLRSLCERTLCRHFLTSQPCGKRPKRVPCVKPSLLSSFHKNLDFDIKLQSNNWTMPRSRLQGARDQEHQQKQQPTPSLAIQVGKQYEAMNDGFPRKRMDSKGSYNILIAQLFSLYKFFHYDQITLSKFLFIQNLINTHNQILPICTS